MSTCQTCGLEQTPNAYCVVVDDYHATYESDYSPTRNVLLAQDEASALSLHNEACACADPDPVCHPWGAGYYHRQV